MSHPRFSCRHRLQRIRGTEFGSIEAVTRHLAGDFETVQPPTLGFRLKQADLVDGVLYANGAASPLRQRGRRWPAYVSRRK